MGNVGLGMVEMVDEGGDEVEVGGGHGGAGGQAPVEYLRFALPSNSTG